MLRYVFAGVALFGAYKFKQCYDRTKKENEYWVESPKDVLIQMAEDATYKCVDFTDALEEKVERGFEKIDKFMDQNEALFDKADKLLGLKK
ncbi:hypothetical protein DMB92_04090 [Campylobacter sp. MIT 99-7217]|uniref:hypothetical protein n=1 Tax=Campylobacter sp. MIT 99-7217 TaxID=535091 RepID=UPI0011570E11|nr:hypothetical protein [Campylobacter sp. MIT 99-7217]TQR33145.1 hypothetical protein DMB92_04090 [Campylobacter sp. MIT 99-7217]